MSVDNGNDICAEQKDKEIWFIYASGCTCFYPYAQVMLLTDDLELG